MVRIAEVLFVFAFLLLATCSSSNKKQEVSCPTGQHDGGDGNCVTVGLCASGYHDGGDGRCVAATACAAGYRDGGNGTCVAAGTCSSGYHDGGDGKCVSAGTCSTGYRVGTGGTCVKAAACASGTHDNGAGVCVADTNCPSGYHDGGTGTCVPVASCSAGYHDGGGGDCAINGTCSTGYHDGGDGKCVPLVACSATYHDGGGGVCVKDGQCSTEYHNGGDGKCVALSTCAVGYHNNGAGACVLSGCASGYHDDGTGKCVTVGCSAGFHDNGAGQCVASGCAAYYHDGGGGTCITWGCSDGYYDNGSGYLNSTATVCLKLPNGCSGDAGCSLPLACISGFHNGGDSCVPVGECSHDHGLNFYNNGQGECVTGGGWWSDASPGTCRTPLMNCVSGYHNGGDDTCVPSGTCLTGYYDDGTGLCCVLRTVNNRGCAVDGGACVQDCASGYNDDGTGACIQTGCASGYHDGGSGACVLLGSCSAGYHDNGVAVCVASGCATGYRDNGVGACVAGADGSVPGDGRPDASITGGPDVGKTPADADIHNGAQRWVSFGSYTFTNCTWPSATDGFCSDAPRAVAGLTSLLVDIFKTSDGGKSWGLVSSINTGTSAYNASINVYVNSPSDMWFVSGSVGVGQLGSIGHSIDGGETWTSLTSTVNAALGTAPGDGGVASVPLWQLAFVGGKVWLLPPQGGNLVVSQDSGVTWKKFAPPADFGLASTRSLIATQSNLLLSFLATDNSLGMYRWNGSAFVAVEGAFPPSSAGNQTGTWWRSSPNAEGVLFMDRGPLPAWASPFWVYATTDGGRTFQQLLGGSIATSSSVVGLSDGLAFAALGSVTAYVCGVFSDASGSRYLEIHRTGDAGKAWSTLHSEPYQGEYAYISVAVDPTGTVHAMRYSTDSFGAAIAYNAHYVLQ